MRSASHILAAFTLISLVPLAVVPQSGGLRYSITVAKFENRSGWHGRWDLGDAWGLVLTDLLNQTGRFIVLGEGDMRAAAMDEQDFAASGRTAGGNKAPVIGQMTPAQLLVKGAIIHVQESTAGGGGGLSVGRVRLDGKGGKGEVNATIYVVDSTTGQVLASKSVVGVSTKKGLSVGYSGHGWAGDLGGFKNDNVGKAVEAACAEAVDFIVAQLPNINWTGSVVMVKDGKFYVNRGSREAVSAGQAFVVGVSEVLRDPDTGEVLDETVTEVARLQAHTVKEKLSICSITSGDASAIGKGMAIHAHGIGQDGVIKFPFCDEGLRIEVDGKTSSSETNDPIFCRQGKHFILVEGCRRVEFLVSAGRTYWYDCNEKCED